MKVRLNEDAAVVAAVREGLKRTAVIDPVWREAGARTQNVCAASSVSR